MVDERLSLPDAVARLGISIEAVCLRLRRGSLSGGKARGRLFVVLPAQPVATGQTTVHTLVGHDRATGRQPVSGTETSSEATGHERLLEQLQAENDRLRADQDRSLHIIEQDAVERAELRRLLVMHTPALPAGAAEHVESSPISAEPTTKPRRPFWRRGQR